MSVGIDVDHHLLILWMIAGVISVAAGVLWTFVSGGGFGVVLVGLKVFPIVIIGGLDSIPGAIVGAMFIGVLASLGTGYLDPRLGGGFGNIASYLLLIGMLVVRPSSYSAGLGSSECSIVRAGIDATQSTCSCEIEREHEHLSLVGILGRHCGRCSGGCQ